MGFTMKSLCGFVAFIMLASSVQCQSSHDMPVMVGSTLVSGPLPYQVSIFSGSTHFCGGALISRQSVLTAASCFSAAQLNQPSTLGVLAASATAIAGDGISRNIFSIDTHPNYTIATRANDIAVVTLASAYDNSLTTVASLTLGTAAVPVQTSCSVSGWGGSTPTEQFSGQLRTLQVNIVDPAITCTPIYSENMEPFNFITESQVCTMPTNVGLGACTTDLGGPLVCNNLLSGILSWGLNCNSQNPTVFTNIVPFGSWVQITRTLREGQAGNGAERVVFSSLLFPILILLNSYLSS